MSADATATSSQAMSNKTVLQQNDLSHHQQQQVCTTRQIYRQGKKLTAVKVYTVSSESQHLFVYGVPKINLRTELKSQCIRYGQLHQLHVVEEVENEAFTECYHVHYQRIQSARIAKRFLDNKSFYGGMLHVCYAPEYETHQELKYKLEQRRYDVLKRLFGEQDVNKPVPIARTYKEPMRKRKRPAIDITEERMNEVDPLLAWKNVPKELDPRKGANPMGQSIPKKYYQEIENEGSKRQKTTILLKTNEVYGPQLPNNAVLCHQGEDDDKKPKNLFVPTQVVLSKEFKFKTSHCKPIKRIVFREQKDS